MMRGILRDRKLYSVIAIFVMEMLLLYNTMIIINYTKLNSVAFVFAIYCLNAYYLYKFYGYLYFDERLSMIYHEIKGEDCINKGFAILHCQSHIDDDKKYNHPLLTNHKIYSSLCIKYQYNFLNMDINDKLEWIRQFNSFGIIYDEYLFAISISISHLVPILWNSYALNVENDQDIILIENKHEWILISGLNTLYCATLSICLLMMVFIDQFDLSINAYLVMNKINSIGYKSSILNKDIQFYDNLPIVKVVMDYVEPDIATIILPYLFEIEVE